MNITHLETAVLDCIVRNTYQPTNGMVPDAYSELSSIWSHSILDADSTYAATVNPRSLPGIVSSLAKKGLVKTYDEGKDSTLYLTETGFAAWEDCQAKGTV